VSTSVDEMAKEFMRTRAQYLDALIAACLRENGCKASELELVETGKLTLEANYEMRWTIRKREEGKAR
jgi:hypothetical protein